MSKPDTGVGPTADVTTEVTYATIAQQVIEMRPRAISRGSIDDVIVLIEYMRDHAVKLHEANAKASNELAQREKAVAKRERDVATRQRAVEAAIKSRSIWARYFKR